MTQSLASPSATSAASAQPQLFRTISAQSSTSTAVRQTPQKMVIMPTTSGVQWIEASKIPVMPGRKSSGSVPPLLEGRPAPPELSFHIDSERGSPLPTPPESDDDSPKPLPEKRRSWSDYPTTPCFASASTAKAPGTVPRIGIDVGGVLTREGDPGYMGSLDEWDTSWEAPGAFDAVRKIVHVFGPENTFLVSKVKPGGNMHRRMEQWLHVTCRFCEVTGILKENIIFVRSIDGPEGKGVACHRYGLSHFVDDKIEVLKAVFEDEAGNSRHLVERYSGILFHFAKGGWGKMPPPVDMGELAPMMRRHYKPVANWVEVLEELRRRLPGTLQKRGMELLTPPTRAPIPFRKPNNASADRAARSPPPWNRGVVTAVGSPTAVRASSAQPPPGAGQASNSAALQWTSSGRPKLVLKPKTAAPVQALASSSGAAACTTVSAAPEAVAVVTKPGSVLAAQVKSPTAHRGSSAQPSLQFDPNGRQKLVLKPRDPRLGPVGQPTPQPAAQPPQPQPQPVLAQPQPVLAQPVLAQPPQQAQQPQQPERRLSAPPQPQPQPQPQAQPQAAMQADPAGGRPRLILKKRAEPVAANATAPVVAPVAAAPVTIATSPTATRSPRNSLTLVQQAAPAPAVCSGPPAPALQKDPSGGRPKLVLKPRTAPVPAA